VDLVVRPRADEALAQRHTLRVIAIEAPEGFGRSTLLRQAVERGPRDPKDYDVLIECGGSVTSADQLARAIATARPDRAPDAHLAYLLDDVDRLDEDALRLVAEMVGAARKLDHVVVTATRLPSIGLPGLLAAGAARLLGRADLALDPDALLARGAASGTGGSVESDDELTSWPLGFGLWAAGRPDFVPESLREIAHSRLDPAARRALAALAMVGGGDRALTEAVLAAVGGASVSLRDLGDLPLVDVVDGGCWPHGVWTDATGADLDVASAAAAAAAASDAHRVAARFDQAGSLAIRSGRADVLARVVRDALDSVPPRVPLTMLEQWLASDVLDPDGGDRAWLEGAIAAHGPSAVDARERLETARRAFEAGGDVAAETAVILHLGSLARRDDDLALLGALLARAQEIAPPTPRLRALVALGEAIGAQLRGDSAAAVAILDAAPSGMLAGDWASQEQMVLGTNLALAGRTEEALLALGAATGTGSPWVRLVAHDLLGSVLWSRGDVDAAIENARLAETLAGETGARTALEQIRATKRCYLAFAGDAGESAARTARYRSGSDEAGLLDGLATIVGLLHGGNADLARARLADLPPGPNRVVRSTLYRAALEIVLLPERRANWDELAARMPALGDAVAAGHAALEHLEHGRPVDERHRPFLPSIWCDAAGSRVAVRLLGGSSVTIDGRLVDHAAWNRGRVRELALHLAVVEGAGRERVAAALWPDLGDAAAAKNLRVTLTYLLDVIDPLRPRGRGSEFVLDGAGELRLAHGPRLRVDIVTLVDSAGAVVAAGAADDRLVVLSAARRMLGAGSGPVLGGSQVGEWFDAVHRRIDDLVLRAISIGGAAAAAGGDHELAFRLGSRGLEIEPWSERSHELVVGARLALGDLDGARRALHTATTELQGLGIEPSRALIELMWRAGMRPALQLAPR
jgi:LuxR family maltose regulon positive regulatory protein